MTDNEKLAAFQTALRALLDTHGIDLRINQPQVEQLGDALLVRPAVLMFALRAPSVAPEKTPEQA